MAINNNDYDVWRSVAQHLIDSVVSNLSRIGWASCKEDMFMAISLSTGLRVPLVSDRNMITIQLGLLNCPLANYLKHERL